MNSHRWTLAGVTVTALAAMVVLIDSDGPRPAQEQSASDPVATVLIWALLLVIIVVVLNLAWTFPMFRGLAYKNQGRIKKWRATRREHRWSATVYASTDGIVFDLSAPADSTIEDEVTVNLTGGGSQYTATVEGPQIQFGTRRLTYWAEYPSAFAHAPHPLSSGRYKVRWSDTSGHRKTARFKVDELGRLRRTLLVRYARWKRAMRQLANDREANRG